MSHKRLFAFDLLRVIAIMGILFCHSCFMWSGCDWLGRYFAQTFNLVFLLISAFLIGMKWEDSGSPQLAVSFIGRRLKRIVVTFYPFLIFALLTLYFMGSFPSTSVVISQFLFLSWFKPLPYFGQLWYLTMIVICYVICYVISNNTLIRSILKGERGWFLFFAVISLAVACMAVSTLSGVPGAIFYMLFYIRLRFPMQNRLWPLFSDSRLYIGFYSLS